MDHSITLHALQARIGEVCIVDARRRTARDTSPEHLPGATWHDPEKLAEWAPALPRDCQIVVYCVLAMRYLKRPRQACASSD